MGQRMAIPDGWSVWFDGELVFSADEDKWETIGPAIARIMGETPGRYAVRGHYHDATGHEDTLCQCPEPGRYAPGPCDPEEDN